MGNIDNQKGKNTILKKGNRSQLCTSKINHLKQ